MMFKSVFTADEATDQSSSADASDVAPKAGPFGLGGGAPVPVTEASLRPFVPKAHLLGGYVTISR